VADLIYDLALALFITHELDAIKRREWRMFPGTHLLDDKAGYTVFTLAHVPLFAVIFWLSDSQSAHAPAFRLGMAVFLIIHVGLHIAFARHPANEFNNPFSQTIIWAAGGMGVLYLIAHANL